MERYILFTSIFQFISMNPPKKTKTPAPEKEKKAKLVRDSFTMPKNEYAAIEALKERALQMAIAIKKSELLRAGLMALSAMDDQTYKAALAAVPTLKTGRPSAKPAETAAEPSPKTVKAPAAPRKTTARRAPDAAPQNAGAAAKKTPRAVTPRQTAAPRSTKAANTQ